MTITLKPEIEAMIREDVARGVSSNVEQYLETAVRSLHARKSFMVNTVEELRDAVEEGWLSAQTGPLYTEEESRAMLEANKAKWLAQRAQEA